MYIDDDYNMQLERLTTRVCVTSPARAATALMLTLAFCKSTKNISQHYCSTTLNANYGRSFMFTHSNILRRTGARNLRNSGLQCNDRRLKLTQFSQQSGHIAFREFKGSHGRSRGREDAADGSREEGH